ncbi:MAG: hypothetical protein ABEI77_09305 [Halorientalis sp.]
MRRTAGFIVGSSLILTASFVGALGLSTGAVGPVQSRLPFYILGMAVIFVVAMFGLVKYEADGMTAMLGAIGISIVGFLFVSLTSEGVLYASKFPGRVFGSQLVVYFLAAGLIGTGLGYWLLFFWRDFTTNLADEA